MIGNFDQDMLRMLPEEDRKKLEEQEALKKAPISMEPLVSNKDPYQQDDLYKSEQNVDPIIEELKKQSQDLELTGRDRALNLGQTISSAVQEAGKVFEQESTGRDTRKERENIQAGQERLQKNLEGREGLRAQLNQKLAERQAAIEAEKLRRDEYLRKVRKDEADIAVKDRLKADAPETVQFAKMLVSRGVPGVSIYKDPTTGKESAGMDRQGLEKAWVDFKKNKADEQTPLSQAEIDFANESLAKAGYKNRLRPGATRAELKAAEKGYNVGLGQQRIDLGWTGEERRGQQFEQSFIQPLPENLNTPQQQRDWYLKGGATKEAKKELRGLQNDYYKGMSEVKKAQTEDFGGLDLMLAEAEKGNALAAQSLMNRLPRVFGGEKGVLTDRDVERLSGSLRLDDKASRFLKASLIDGYRATPGDLAEVKQVLAALKQNKAKLSDIFMDVLDSKVKSTFGDNANARWIFGQGNQSQSTGQTQQSGIQSPAGSQNVYQGSWKDLIKKK